MIKTAIISDGNRTALFLDGVLIGKGIQKLEFSTEDRNGKGSATVRLLEINVRLAEVLTGTEATERLFECLQE